MITPQPGRNSRRIIQLYFMKDFVINTKEETAPDCEAIEPVLGLPLDFRCGWSYNSYLSNVTCSVSTVTCSVSIVTCSRL